VLYEKALKNKYKITWLIFNTKISINTTEYEHGRILEYHLLLGQMVFFLLKLKDPRML